MTDEHPSHNEFVRRPEFGLAQELGRERHGTLMLRLDALEASLRVQKDSQDVTWERMREQMHGVVTALRFLAAAVTLLCAINAPGLLKVLKGLTP